MSLNETIAVQPSKARKPVAKPAAKRRGRAKPARRPALSPADLAAAEKLFRSFAQQLEPGIHVFSTLRRDFTEWTEAADMVAISDTRLGTWLQQAGFARQRVGREKTVAYTKPAPRPPMAAAQACRIAIQPLSVSRRRSIGELIASIMKPYREASRLPATA